MLPLNRFHTSDRAEYPEFERQLRPRGASRMTPTEAEAAARDAQERYAMLLAMIEYGKAERARYERQMACVRPRIEEDENDG